VSKPEEEGEDADMKNDDEEEEDNDDADFFGKNNT
jgi:hypothetical protein